MQTPADRWEADIRAFEEADRRKRPDPGGVVFVGSSSIRMWKTLVADFPNVRQPLNRGFGGSQLADSVRYAPRIVIPYSPRLVVLYAGDNDLASGKRPDQVIDAWRQFVDVVHGALPETRIVYLLIKPSIARLRLMDQMEATNRRIIGHTMTNRRLLYADTFHPLLGSDGQPIRELFIQDGLHLNADGYARWRQAVAPFVW